MRRFQWYDAVSKNVMPLPQERLPGGSLPALVAHVKQWLNVRIMAFADQAFEELYQKLVEEAYDFPGKKPAQLPPLF
jgi:hypothetical protein